MCLSAILSADTIVLRDGRRVEGDLVAVHEGVIEFDGAARRLFRRTRAPAHRPR